MFEKLKAAVSGAATRVWDEMTAPKVPSSTPSLCKRPVDTNDFMDYVARHGYPLGIQETRHIFRNFPPEELAASGFSEMRLRRIAWGAKFMLETLAKINGVHLYGDLEKAIEKSAASKLRLAIEVRDRDKAA